MFVLARVVATKTNNVSANAFAETYWGPSHSPEAGSLLRQQGTEAGPAQVCLGLLLLGLLASENHHDNGDNDDDDDNNGRTKIMTMTTMMIARDQLQI